MSAAYSAAKQKNPWKMRGFLPPQLGSDRIAEIQHALKATMHVESKLSLAEARELCCSKSRLFYGPSQGVR